MIHSSEVIVTISYMVGILGSGGAVFSFLRFSSYKETVKLQNDNIKALQDSATILQAELDKHKKAQTDNVKAIANLEGKLATYKEIPLKSIAESLEKLTESNAAVLGTLQKSATLLDAEKSDGGMLVKTKDSKPLSVKVK